MNVKHHRKKGLVRPFQAGSIHIQVKAVLHLDGAVLEVGLGQVQESGGLGRLRADALVVDRIKSTREGRLGDRSSKTAVTDGRLGIMDAQETKR